MSLVSREIKVKATFEVGKELILQRKTDVEQVKDIKSRETNNSSSLKILPAKIRNYQLNLSPGQENISIKDFGLALQYAILGTPGVGKTNLLMHLATQIVKYQAQDPENSNQKLKYGGLILDPTASLIEMIKKIFRECGREEDLIILSTEDLLKIGGVNILDCELSPEDKALALKIAAQSSGYGGADPFWFQQMSKVFGAILRLMKFYSLDTLGDKKLKKLTTAEKKEFLDKLSSPTLKRLMDFSVGYDDNGTPKIEILLATVIKHLPDLLKDVKYKDEFEDDKIALDTLRTYISSESREKNTIQQFMEQAFGIFRNSSYAKCYSAPNQPDSKSLYAQIVEEGKFIVVSTSPHEMELSTILPTLVKLIFQRTVLSRFQQYEKSNNPLLFMADEYHTVATQLKGVPFGDSEFFSQARKFGVLCLVATQSIEQLEASRLGEYWKAVFNTLAAVIFMRSNGASNQEYLDTIAGKAEYLIHTVTQSTGLNEASKQYNISLEEKSVVPLGILTLLKRGQAVICGTTEGHSEPISIQYVQIPPAGEGI